MRLGPIMRKPEALNFTGFCETVFDEKVELGEIAPPIKLSDDGRAKAWLRSEMEAWLQKRIAARDAELLAKKRA
jgi:predicted DNA-binding transcriptional regulator AlpA